MVLLILLLLLLKFGYAGGSSSIAILILLLLTLLLLLLFDLFVTVAQLLMVFFTDCNESGKTVAGIYSGDSCDATSATVNVLCCCLVVFELVVVIELLLLLLTILLIVTGFVIVVVDTVVSSLFKNDKSKLSAYDEYISMAKSVWFGTVCGICNKDKKKCFCQIKSHSKHPVTNPLNQN